MVEFALNTHLLIDHPNLNFQALDALAMDFEDEFDVVFSNATLHWVNDHETLLIKIARSLVPGGRFLAQMGGKGNAAPIFEVLDEIMAIPEWSKFFSDFEFPWYFHEPNDYIQWLSQAGLKARRVELIQKDNEQPSKDGLAGWLYTTWLPYVHRVPENLQARFVSTIVEAYIAKYPSDEDGTVHLPMTRLEVDAVKLT